MPPQKTVLIVDNDQGMRATLQRLLTQNSYQTKLFDDPQRFIDSINPSYGEAHCLILDMRMRGLQSLDVQRAITSSGIRLPVIFLSAESHVAEAIAGLKASRYTRL